MRTLLDQPTRWSHEQDRTYHGVLRHPKLNEKHPARIFVELSEFGPTQRESAVLLYELEPRPQYVHFSWGYIGRGATVTAEAILADAVGGDSEINGDLREAFCEDVVTQLSDDFHLRRGAVLRWALGWATAVGRQDCLPAAARTPPPVDHLQYAARPSGLRARQGAHLR